MVDILSEVRKIESLRQLANSPTRHRIKIEKRIWNLETKQAHARERPHRRGGGRSKWTRSETRKAGKRTRFEGCELKKERETR